MIKFLSDTGNIHTEGRILGTLAHEFGHGLDDTVRTPSPRRVWTDGIKDCLMRQDSIGAHQNQVNEALADWFAAEILAKYIKVQKQLTQKQAQEVLIQASVDSCDPVAAHNPNNDHPRWDLRTNRIFMANPVFREVFGCPKINDVRYCRPDLKGPL